MEGILFCGNLVLDFLHASRHFNVQSAAIANPFWTFSVLSAASTSNPPHLRIPFGLPPCLPPLQRPICRSRESLLDFFPPSLCFNVQSAALVNPFWTFSVFPAASTSNPPLWRIKLYPVSRTLRVQLFTQFLSCQ